MKLKEGVRILGIRPEVALAMIIVEGVYQEHGYELVVTSGVDGTHSQGSLHYSGGAFDCRTYFVDTDKEVAEIAHKIRESLGDEFDVVVEDTHIHVEWQPKGAINQ